MPDQLFAGVDTHVGTDKLALNVVAKDLRNNEAFSVDAYLDTATCKLSAAVVPLSE